MKDFRLNYDLNVVAKKIATGHNVERINLDLGDSKGL